jgi:hypothetical protein
MLYGLFVVGCLWFSVCWFCWLRVRPFVEIVFSKPFISLVRNFEMTCYYVAPFCPHNSLRNTRLQRILRF